MVSFLEALNFLLIALVPLLLIPYFAYKILKGQRGQLVVWEFQGAPISGLILAAYSCSVLGSRLLTMVTSPGISVTYGPFHFHHILWGLVLMTVGALMGFFWQARWSTWLGCSIFGLGLGLAVDEVGLVLLTQDSGYFNPISYVAIALVAVILLIFFLIHWRMDRRTAKR